MARAVAVVILSIIIACTVSAQSPGAPDAKKQPAAETEGKRLIQNLEIATVAVRNQLPLRARLVSVATKPRGGQRSMLKVHENAFTGAGLVGALSIHDAEGIVVVLENKTDDVVRILWDEASFIDAEKRAHRLVKSGTRLIDRNGAQPPTTIPPGARHSDTLFPSDLIEWRDEGWHYGTVLTIGYMKYVGDAVRLFLPVEVGGRVVDLTAQFEIEVSEQDLKRAVDAERAAKFRTAVKEGVTRDDVMTAMKEVGYAGAEIEEITFQGEKVEMWTFPNADVRIRFDASGTVVMVDKTKIR